MAALFRVSIKQLEVKAVSVFFRAAIQLCLHSFHMAWIFPIAIQTLQFRGYIKKTPNTHIKHQNKQSPHRIIPRGGCSDFFSFFM